MVLEFLELFKVGPRRYFSDVWNLMDWINFIIYIVTFNVIRDTIAAEDRRVCNDFCDSFGYCDDGLQMGRVRSIKMFLSWCVCIQLLKIIKFTDTLVPKMDLATAVLYKARVELLFFTFVFVISMLAFSQLFYVQLGPVMEQFNTQQGALISLVRSLFGDFDIDAILSNSRDYLNALLFLTYLFVAVFILLSMFLAILGEAQGAVRASKSEAEATIKAEGKDLREYGVFDDLGRFLRKSRRAISARVKARQQARQGADGGGSSAGEGTDEENARTSRRSVESMRDSSVVMGSAGDPSRNKPARRKDLVRLGDVLSRQLSAQLASQLASSLTDQLRGDVAAQMAAASEARVASLIEAKLLPKLLEDLDKRAGGAGGNPTAAGGGIAPPSLESVSVAGRQALERAATSRSGGVHRRNNRRVASGSTLVGGLAPGVSEPNLHTPAASNGAASNDPAPLADDLGVSASPSHV